MEEIRYIEIVAQYQDMVYRIAFHDCRNSHDAEDVMQTVFMKLYQKNPEFDNEEHLKHWLIRVTMNECKRLIASPWKKRMEFFPEAVQQIAMVFKNVTVDQEASTPYETVLHAEDGTQITAVHEYGENGEYYVTLVYHEDTKRLGLTIEDKEIDITDQLKEKGVYTQDYTFEGEERRLTVTGTPEDPKLETEILIK